MSPEQAAGEAADTASYLFSFGIVLQELLTGETPYPDGTWAEVLYKVQRAEVAPPKGLAPELERILRDLLHHDPGARPTAIEALQSLRHYRDRGRRRRRRVLSAAVGILILIAVTFGLRASYERHTAARETALAARLEGELRLIEATMRHARTAPQHDVTAERRQAKDRLEQMRLSLGSGDRELPRVGAAALGRGWLVLGAFEGAREHLQQAWDEGYRPPAVAYALGITLGRLYEEAHVSSASAPESAASRERLEQAELRYRIPAEAALRSAAGVELEAQELIEAALSYYGGDPERSSEILDRASERVPWIYEAELLRARIHQAAATEIGAEMGSDAATERFEAARSAYARAAEIARSDPRVFGALCTLISSRMGELVSSIRHEERRSLLAAGQEACGTTLEIDPEAERVRALEGALVVREAEARLYYGEDVRADLAAGIELIEAELAHAPHPATWNQLGIALDLVAYDAVFRGEDPTPSLDRTIAAYRSAVELDPEMTDALAHMLYRLYVKAEHLLATGGDPSGTAEEAFEVVERVRALDPRRAGVHMSLNVILLLQAIRELWMEMDPTATVERSLEALELELELEPGSAFAHGNVAEVLLVLAEYQEENGMDTTEALARAELAAERSLELQGDLYYVPGDLARIQAIEGSRGSRTGLDAGEAFATARRFIQMAVESKPHAAQTYCYQAEIELRLARHELGIAGDALPAVRAARQSAQMALEHSSDLASAHLLEAGIVSLAEEKRSLHTSARSLAEKARRSNANLTHRVQKVLSQLDLESLG